MTNVDLCNAALDIQMRRKWSTAQCSELSGIACSTWKDAVVRAQSRPTLRIGALLKAFVDTYRNDDVFVPPRSRWKRGPEHHLSKRTPEMIARILASNAKGVELARELGVSNSLVTRVRQGNRNA